MIPYGGIMSFALFRNLSLAALGLLAVAIRPALAQQPPPQPRILHVPSAASWQHAATQMILPPRAAGLERAEVRDGSDAELDVMAHYVDRPEGVLATVYVFKTQVPDAALWFDRALHAIPLSPGWSLEAAAPPAPVPFARPGTSVASGLRTVFAVSAPQFRSTALAVAPLGQFLVKVRISAARLDPAGLDALLSRFLGDLRWPAAGAERAATPIQDCAEPLRLRQARVVWDDMDDVLM
ncbi:MAG: hypothetical protein M3177_06730, partial [Pseudomonadota bacterium]|nr:hypothetical protein [Pseudomonadota bacterium]